jgi:hypothetical protein
MMSNEEEKEQFVQLSLWSRPACRGSFFNWQWLSLQQLAEKGKFEEIVLLYRDGVIVKA